VRGAARFARRTTVQSHHDLSRRSKSGRTPLLNLLNTGRTGKESAADGLAGSCVRGAREQKRRCSVSTPFSRFASLNITSGSREAESWALPKSLPTPRILSFRGRLSEGNAPAEESRVRSDGEPNNGFHTCRGWIPATPEIAQSVHWASEAHTCFYGRLDPRLLDALLAAA
jgi:hypothetical protein